MRHHALWLPLFALVAVGTGCSEKSSGATADLKCHGNDDCEGGRVCVDGECLVLCSTDLQCGEGMICTEELCRPGARANVPEILALDGDSEVVCFDDPMKHCITAAGLVVEEDTDNIGMSHTLMRCVSGG